MGKHYLILEPGIGGSERADGQVIPLQIGPAWGEDELGVSTQLVGGDVFRGFEP